MPQKSRKEPKVQTTYEVTAVYSGLDYDLDAALRRAVSKSSSGSGYGLGCRDIGWSYLREGAARKAVRDLRLAAKKAHRRVKVTLTAWDEDGTPTKL